MKNFNSAKIRPNGTKNSANAIPVLLSSMLADDVSESIPSITMNATKINKAPAIFDPKCRELPNRNSPKATISPKVEFSAKIYKIFN